MRLNLLLLAMLMLASLVTTILGWVAVSQIRRSAGKLHGMWLAVFDGLLFPLIGLFAGISVLTREFAVGFLGWSRNYDPVHNSQGIFMTCVLWTIASFFIIRAVWRAVNPGIDPSTVVEPRRSPMGFIGWAVAIVALLVLAVGIYTAGKNKHAQRITQDLSLFIGQALAAANIQYDQLNVETSGNEIKAFVSQPMKLKEVNGGKVSTPLKGTLVIHRTKNGWTVRGTEDLSSIAITRNGATTLSGPEANGIATAEDLEQSADRIPVAHPTPTSDATNGS